MSAPPSNLVVQQFIKSSLRAETWHPEPRKESAEQRRSKETRRATLVAGGKGAGGLRRTSGPFTALPGPPWTSGSRDPRAGQRPEPPPDRSPLPPRRRLCPSAAFTSSRRADTSAGSQVGSTDTGVSRPDLGCLGPMAEQRRRRRQRQPRRPHASPRRRRPRRSLPQGERWARPGRPRERGGSWGCSGWGRDITSVCK